MSRQEQRSNGEGEHPETEAYGLVCALCERRLDGRFETRAQADMTADEHAVGEHPGRDEVVILTAPLERLDPGIEPVLQRAREMQPGLGNRAEDQEEAR